MPIFSRRAIQARIDRSPRFLDGAQIAKFVRDLNNGGSQAIPWEWELVVMSALSQLGDVKYELKTALGRAPDVRYFPPKAAKAAFVAEIATVSDKFVHRENPVQRLVAELWRRVTKRGLSPDAFSLRIGSNIQGARQNRGRVRLKIPKSESGFRSEIFTRAFDSFLGSLKVSPPNPPVYQVKNENVDVTIFYKPSSRFFSFSHPGYDLPRHVERNSIYHALRRKAAQLQNADASCGIFLCDGGCHALSDFWSKGLTLPGQEIIRVFLEKHENVAFVVAFGVRDDPASDQGKSRYRVESRVFEGRHYDTISCEVTNTLKALAKQMPRPEMTPAIVWLREAADPGAIEHSFFGGSIMQHRSLTIPGRAILELLAGRTSHQKFLRAHNPLFGEGTPHETNFFEARLKEGKLIADVKVEKCPERDDDWVTITFSDPDPAVSSFRVPKQVPPT